MLPITIPMTVSSSDTTIPMDVQTTEEALTVPVSTQVAYTGPKGDPGPAGSDGQDGAPGEDGFSPTIQIVDIEDRHVIAITDKNGTHTTTILDGSDGIQGPKGDKGDPGESIKGDKGDKGDPGESIKGDKGDKGDPGDDYVLTSSDKQDIADIVEGQITIPTKTSDLVNDSNFMSGMTILSYGHSTWADFIAAYTANHVVYCRASSNSNPATGSQTRMAFMAYVSNADNPTNVEFQYYRSVNQHSASQQGDQVYVYKLDKTAGWTVTVREAMSKIAVGAGLNLTYSNGVLTISLA